MKGLHMVTFVLLIIGGLNWGLEVFGWGIGSFLSVPIVKVVYVLVAVSAIVEIFSHRGSCKHCEIAKPMGTV